MGNVIRKYRIELGITQEELASKIGVTQGAVWQWENGISTPKVGNLRKIASILNCTIEDLIKAE